MFAGSFRSSSDDYEQFRETLKKLELDDSALHSSPRCRPRWLRLPLRVPRAAAHGNRAGTLEREYDLDLITSAPTVIYEVPLTDGSVVNMDNPTKLPRRTNRSVREPIITANILVPPEYVGAVLALCSEKRGVQKKMISRHARYRCSTNCR